MLYFNLHDLVNMYFITKLSTQNSVYDTSAIKVKFPLFNFIECYNMITMSDTYPRRTFQDGVKFFFDRDRDMGQRPPNHWSCPFFNIMKIV